MIHNPHQPLKIASPHPPLHIPRQINHAQPPPIHELHQIHRLRVRRFDDPFVQDLGVAREERFVDLEDVRVEGEEEGAVGEVEGWVFGAGGGG